MTRWERFKRWFQPLVYQGTQVHGKSVVMTRNDGVTHRWDHVDRYIKGTGSQFDDAYGIDKWVWVEVLLMNGKRDSYSMDVLWMDDVKVTVQ